MRRYGVYTDGTEDRNRQGYFKKLTPAREHALKFFTQTRDIQIFLEWEIRLPFGWMLIRSKKLTDWHTGATT